MLAICSAAALAQPPSADPDLPDYTRPAKPFPALYQPYQPHRIPEAVFRDSDGALPAVENGKLRLSLAQLVAAVVENNLAIAGARYFPSIAQTDLLRARSGASPRGVDASQIPGGVFSGAEGGSILGTAGGGGGGSSNPGGITGSAGRVSIRPAGLFDPTVSFSFSMDRTASPLNSLVVAGISSVTTNTAAFSANYVQAFSTGTSFTFSYGVQRQGSTQRHLLFDPAITPGFTMTLSQQLLNGFGFDVNRALIKVAENEQKIERESFRQQVTTALVAAENAYWDLLAAQEAVRAAEQARAVAQQLEEENKKQFLIGTMANLDVITAQSQAAASERDLIVARTAVQNAELELKSMLSRSLDEPLASAAIEITDTFPEADGAPIPTQEQAVATAMASRPDLAVAEGNLKSQQDVMPFIRNALLPNFNVFALVTTVGLYNVFGTSFTEAIHFRYPEAAFGVTVTFPMRNRQAQADDVRARLTLQQSKDTLVRSKSQVEVDVENALIALKQSRARVAAAQEAVRLERLKLDAEQKKLANGLSTSYNLILAQRDLFTAELAEAQARDAFAKARISLDQVTGVTLEANHVSLDEALRGRLSSR
jgi:outer membrane protein TolC